MKPTNANELVDLDAPEFCVVWGPAFCLYNLVMLYGPTGIGKTYTLMKLAHTMASGGVWLQWAVTNPVRVLYVNTELPMGSIKRRFLQIQAEAAYSPRGDHFMVLSREHCGGRMWNISSPADQTKYNEAIGDSQVIVIDNLLGSMFPLHGRDDDVAQWERVMPWLFALRDSGRMVIVVHHTGKNGTQLGTSIKENFVDTSVELRAPMVQRPIRGTEFDWIWKKTRDVKRSDAQPMHVEYAEQMDGVSRWTWEPLNNSTQNSIRELRSKGQSKREVARALGISFRDVELAWEQEELNI